MSKVAPHFTAVLKLIAAGETLIDALASDPAFPIKATWKSYVFDKRFPQRRAMVESAQAKGRAARAAKGFAVYHYTEEDYTRSLLIVSSSDPAVRLIDLPFDGVPGYTMLHRRAQTDVAFGKRLDAAKGNRKHGGRALTYSDDDMQAAVAAIQTGGLGAYKQSAADGPSHSQIWKRAKRDAALARDYREAVESRTNRQRVARSADDLYGRVAAAVPSRLDPDARDDVISDIVEAVLSGRLPEDRIASRCADFVAAHNRAFSRFKAISLDAPLYDDSARNLLDDLTTDPAHQWGM